MTSAKTEFPVIQLSKVYHVGTMDFSQKERGSYEGAGLSVSTVPNAWRRIIPLPGKIFSLIKHDSKFLDYHKFARSKMLREQVILWGIQNCYIENGFIYQFCYEDDEFEMTLCSVYRNKEEAKFEAEGYEAKVQKKRAILSLPKLDERVLYGRPSEAATALELLSTVYADDVLNVDGVWWNDKLDISRFSAPRGTIFQRKLPEWNIAEENNIN